MSLSRNLSTAFDPSIWLPGDPDAHAQGHTLLETVGSQSQRPRSIGALLSSPIFEWWEWESNRQPSGYWTTHWAKAALIKAGY